MSHWQASWQLAFCVALTGFLLGGCSTENYGRVVSSGASPAQVPTVNVAATFFAVVLPPSQMLDLNAATLNKSAKTDRDLETQLSKLGRAMPIAHLDERVDLGEPSTARLAMELPMTDGAPRPNQGHKPREIGAMLKICGKPASECGCWSRPRVEVDVRFATLRQETEPRAPRPAGWMRGGPPQPGDRANPQPPPRRRDRAPRDRDDAKDMPGPNDMPGSRDMKAMPPRDRRGPMNEMRPGGPRPPGPPAVESAALEYHGGLQLNHPILLIGAAVLPVQPGQPAKALVVRLVFSDVQP